VVVVALSGGHADAVGRIRMVGVDQLGLSPAELGELPSMLAGSADQKPTRSERCCGSCVDEPVA
jgi:hypothetical protein